MSTFGSFFRVTTFGESHCRSVGCIIDGCPPGLSLTESDIQPQLTRRRPGQSSLTTPRDEKDKCVILSGTEAGITLGTPIAIQVMNEDQRPQDYNNIDTRPRPSHADYTYLLKYGVKASSGGGRSSARETIGRVAAGAVAEHYLKQTLGVEIVAFVSSVGPIAMTQESVEEMLPVVTREMVDKDPIRCPETTLAEGMKSLVMEMKEKHDSIGGTVTCVIRNCPPGLGEPTFDKLTAMLAHAIMSIPATKGFEIGSGFAGTCMSGSKHNDPFIKKELRDGTWRLGTSTNHSGGTQGGISNGEPIYFRVAFKPPATISMPQETSDLSGEKGILAAKGRHDPCVVPRACPIVEAMSALVIMDMLMAQCSRVSLSQGLFQSLGPVQLPLRDQETEEQRSIRQVLMTGGRNGYPDSMLWKK